MSEGKRAEEAPWRGRGVKTHMTRTEGSGRSRTCSPFASTMLTKENETRISMQEFVCSLAWTGKLNSR